MSRMIRTLPFLATDANAFKAFSNKFKKYFLPVLPPKAINADVKAARIVRKSNKTLKRQQHIDAVGKAHCMRVERKKAIKEAL